MKPNYCVRHYSRTVALAALPILVGVSALLDQRVVTLALGAIGALIVVIYGVYQWRYWQRVITECEHIEAGNEPAGLANAVPAEFDAIFTTFSVLESRRRLTHEAFERSLGELRERLIALADGAQTPKVLTAPKIAGLSTGPIDTALLDLHRAITQVRQRMAGMTRLMGALPEPLIILDESERIRYMNSAAEQILGKKLTDCMKQPFVNFLAAPAYADPLGRTIIAAESLHGWLTNGNQDDVVADFAHSNGQATRVGLILARPTGADRERLYCIAARPLSRQYGQVNSLVRDTRSEAVQAAWQGIDGTLHPASEHLQTQVRLLTAEVKQSSLRNTLLGRVQTLQQISNRVDLFLRLNHWFGLCLQKQLPTPQPLELAGFDLARLVADKLNPIFKSAKTTITVHNDGAGWVHADEDWLQMAVLGVLWHAGQAAPGGMVEVHVSHQEPSPNNPEGSLVYRFTAPGSTLTAELLGHWEHAFDGIAIPQWLDPATPGYLPGVQLARYLVAHMGGSMVFDATPSRALAVRLVLPARLPNSTATPAERLDGPALEELCMGWTLGVA